MPDLDPITITLSVIPRRHYGAGQPFCAERVLDIDFWKRVFSQSRKFGDPRVEIVGIKTTKKDAEALSAAISPTQTLVPKDGTPSGTSDE